MFRKKKKPKILSHKDTKEVIQQYENNIDSLSQSATELFNLTEELILRDVKDVSALKRKLRKKVRDSYVKSE